jgi:hypothetical protein
MISLAAPNGPPTQATTGKGLATTGDDGLVECMHQQNSKPGPTDALQQKSTTLLLAHWIESRVASLVNSKDRLERLTC